MTHTSPVVGVMTAADMFSPAALVAHARRLEAAGHEAMWMPDIFGREIYSVRIANIQNRTGVFKPVQNQAARQARFKRLLKGV